MIISWRPLLSIVLTKSVFSRYRVELSVDDGNDNATFVVFDREMLNLIKKDASTLTVEEVCFQKT